MDIQTNGWVPKSDNPSNFIEFFCKANFIKVLHHVAPYTMHQIAWYFIFIYVWNMNCSPKYLLYSIRFMTELFFSLQLDITPSQLLVTENDFENPKFTMQLCETVNSLLSSRVVPIFNENDAVSTRCAPYKVLSN